MISIWNDLRYAARMLLKHPVVTVVAVITLALSIGANTAIFSVVNAVMLKPLPYRNPDRLVALWENVPQRGRWRVTPANFFDWKNQSTVFEDIVAFGASTMTFTGRGEPEQLLGTRASSGYFNVVGVDPALGRTFLSEEHEPGKGQVVILSHNLWLRRFGGDPAILHQSITLDGASYTVVGVMPPALFPGWPTTSGRISFDQAEQQFWLPMSFSPQWASVRTAHVLGVLGRLKPGVTIAQAQSEMNTIAARLEQEYAANKGEGILVNDFTSEVVGNVRPLLWTLFGAVGLVLLIACANIAGLLLAQYAARTKEVAIRAALGAGRGQIVRQFFLEGLLLAVLGTGAGVLLARFGIDLILKLIPSQLPRFSQTQLDLRVLGFTIVVSLLTCLLFGLIPAWQASKADVQGALEQGRRIAGAGGKQRLRQLLVVFQICLAMMLVISAGLLIRSFRHLRQVDPGFKSDNVLTLTLTLPGSKYSETHQINGFYNQLLQSIGAIPGVTSTAIAYDHPLQANWIDSFAIEGRPVAPGESFSANFNPVSWDYFKTLGTPLLAGRHFTAQDDPDHPGAAIVNEAFVRRYFPDQSAVGKRIKPSPPARIWRNEKFTSFEIVGVVRDVKSAGLAAASEPTYYIPASQAPLTDMTILVHSQGDPTALVPALRSAVWAIDPNQPIATIATLEKIVADSIAQSKLSMVLMGLFGVLALILAALGIYGLLSYSVAQRTQELGIRMALGAQVSDVLKLVLKQGMILMVIGVVTGLLGALAVTRLMSGLLFGVTATDSLTYVAVAGVLATVALIACYVPARRAAKVDPLVALRNE